MRGWTNYLEGPEEGESPSDLKGLRMASWTSGSKLAFEDGKFSMARAGGVGHPRQRKCREANKCSAYVGNKTESKEGR